MLELIFVFIVGSVVGSFLNVCIYRLPEKVSIAFPASYCPNCRQAIPKWSNIPFLGYLLLKGKCKHCSTKISWQYPAVELLAAVLTVITYWYHGFSALFTAYIILVYFLIVIAFIDWKTQLIYDKVLVILFLCGLTLQLIYPFIAWESALLGVVVGGLSMFAIALLGKAMFKKDSLGMGDVKLAAVVGFFVGWQTILIALYFGFLLAFVTIIITKRFGHSKLTGYIPLGPFLAGGIVIFLFWGKQLLQLYISLVT